MDVFDPANPSFDERWAQLLGLPAPQSPALPVAATNSLSLPQVPMPTPRPPGLGESLDPVAAAPAAPDVSAVAPAAAQAAAPTTAAAGAVPTNALANALRGVQAMKPPEPQRVATPHPPAQRPIQGGELVNMLAALGMGPRDVFSLPKLRG